MKSRGPRHNAREYALRILYSLEINPCEGNPSFGFPTPNTWDGEDPLSIPFGARDFAMNLALGALSKLGEIDQRIQKQSRQWRMDRMSRIDRNILRLAVYELMTAKDTAPSVILDEALELAKCYGDSNSSKFVNGVLDPIALDLRGDRAPA